MMPFPGKVGPVEETGPIFFMCDDCLSVGR